MSSNVTIPQSNRLVDPSESADIRNRDANTPRSAAVLPAIIVNRRPLRDVSKHALDALLVANDPPVIFRQGGRLVWLVRDEHRAPRIEVLTEAAFRGRLARVANWYRGGRTAHHVAPPLNVVRDLLALDDVAGFPPLTGITRIPWLRPDGSLVAIPGYDAITGLFYDPDPTLTIPTIPDHPSDADIENARAVVGDVIKDFPFVDEASRTNAVALLLTVVIRPAIRGCVPLVLIDSPTMGTGKGLLAEVASLIATGRPAGVVSEAESEAEWRKRITSILRGATALAVIDNLERQLDSASLAAALTAEEWEDRPLGSSTMIRLPARTIWVGTGNNVRVGADLRRRCYWIRLDAEVARPWERSGFRHPNLRQWTRDRRGQLVAALLTLGRAWFVAGCPDARARLMGSFEEWTRIIGGILAYAGFEGFLGNTEALYELVDREGVAWEVFLSVWLQEIGDHPATIAELAHWLDVNNRLRDVLPDALSDSAAYLQIPRWKLARAIEKRVDRRYGPRGLRLERVPGNSQERAVRWCVRADLTATESVRVSPRVAARVDSPDTSAGNEDSGRPAWVYEMGKVSGFPSLRLGPAETLAGGEGNWRALCYGEYGTPRSRERLLAMAVQALKVLAEE